MTEHPPEWWKSHHHHDWTHAHVERDHRAAWKPIQITVNLTVTEPSIPSKSDTTRMPGVEG